MNLEETVALSEHEQRLLEEMERGLYASEADSLQTGRASGGVPSYRAIVIGLLIALAGVGVLIWGAAVGMIWLGLIGFVAMLFGTVFIFDPKNRVQKGQGSGRSSTPSSRASFADRAERRWEQRMDGDR